MMLLLEDGRRSGRGRRLMGLRLQRRERPRPEQRPRVLLSGCDDQVMRLIS